MRNLTQNPIDTIKEIAARLGRCVPELLALSVNNDPYYFGTRTDIARAEWFSEQWHRFDFPHGVHLRRIHYVLVSQDPPISMRDSTPYENTDHCWHELGLASKAARYLGLVDISAFDDRRNPPAVEYESGPCGFVNVASHSPQFTVYVPDLGALKPSITVECVTHSPAYHLEVWCEKSTMNDVLLPICREHQCNLVTGLGELSITACDKFVDRIGRSGRPGRIFYISDYDPGGQSMPVAVARKIEFLAERRGGRNVLLYSVALRPEQIDAYNLPRTPIKSSERRRASFEAKNGIGAVELDALEALNPGELGRIVAEYLKHYCDPNIDGEVDRYADALQERANENAELIATKHESEIRAAAAGLSAIQQSADSWNMRHLDLSRAIREELEAATEDLHVNSEPPQEPTVEDLADALLDTRRSYLEQLACYKAFQKKDVPGDKDAAA